MLSLLAARAYAAFLPDSPFTNDARGLTGAAFLKQPVGARPTALAESYAAAAGEADALFWNPAGLSRLKRPELSASYDSLLLTAYSSALSFGFPVRGGVWAGSVLYHSQSAVDAFDEVGDPTGSFTPYDLAVSIGWAGKVEEDHLGAAVKLLDQKLAGESALGWAADLGWQRKDAGQLAESPLDAGIAVRNLGSPIQLGNEADPLPLTLLGGFHWKTRPNLSTFLDLHLPADHSPFLSIGEEVRMPAGQSTFALRGGYSMGRRGELSGLAGLAAGLGFDVGSLRADYAWTPLGDLGTTHRFTLGLRF